MDSDFEIKCIFGMYKVLKGQLLWLEVGFGWCLLYDCFNVENILIEKTDFLDKTILYVFIFS